MARAVRNPSPQQFQLESALWTLALSGELVERQCGKRRSRSAVGRVMRLLGFTPQRALYRASQRGPVLMKRWRDEAYPAIAADAKRVGR